jgi:hypothetical protein
MPRSRTLFILPASLLLIAGSGATVFANEPNYSLAAFGTATIDGVMSPGEWDRAAQVPFSGGTLFVMNDAHDLYVAVRAPATVLDPSSVVIEFDNSGGLLFVTGDDVIGVNSQLGFLDNVRLSDLGPMDTEVGGTSDGAAAVTNDGSFSFYEISHPLDDVDDAHDFSLSAGATVGFFLNYRVCPPAAGACTDVTVPPPSASGPGEITIVPELAPSVAAAPAALWPPDHRLVPVSVTFDLPGAWEGSAIKLISATSSEPDGPCRSRHGSDIQGADIGTADTQVLLRAERSRPGVARAYTLTYEVTSPAGQKSVLGATVPVARPAVKVAAWSRGRN